MLIKLPLPAEDQEGNQWGGGKEVLINFSNAGAVTANLKLEVFFLRLEHAGRSAVVWASIAFQRKSDTTALARCYGKVELWPRNLTIHASSEDSRGHLKETSLSGNELTWLLLKLDLM